VRNNTVCIPLKWNEQEDTYTSYGYSLTDPDPTTPTVWKMNQNMSQVLAALAPNTQNDTALSILVMQYAFSTPRNQVTHMTTTTPDNDTVVVPVVANPESQAQQQQCIIL